ncbi:hypothetical protein ACFFMN_05745 [Planobispora siamensis]|uniref:Uncharacterized protein n=1 Tax=Planobispora siamensis TaxID=936338 RepID=A0A8J3SL27_9ACTN|nr:hypothetical protein [Planobispora siamensis]GIH94314.1 hypothetical protein Psi01_49440 [Planobispora siamensis]
MHHDPSPGELARRLNDLQYAAQRLTSQELFLAEQRASERRFTSIERDLEELQRRIDEELKSIISRIEARERDRGANWRQSVYAGVIPAGLLLVSLLVQIWLSLNGTA